MIKAIRSIPRHRLVLSLILAFALFMRLFYLWNRNLWADETSSFILAYITFDKGNLLVPWQLFNSQPYILLLASWIKLSAFFGFTLPIEFLLRFPSVIFGCLSIGIIYLIAKSIFDIKTALISAYLLAFSVFHIWYSQEARAYSLWVFFILASVFFLIGWEKTRRNKYCYIFLLCAFLSLWVNPIALLLYFSCAPLLFTKDKRYLRIYIFGLIVTTLFMILLFSFINTSALLRLQHQDGIFWTLRPVKQSILFTFENFNVGYNSSKALYLISDFVFFSLLFFGVLCSLRNNKKYIVMLLFLVFLPPIFLYLFSVKLISIYLDRYLIFCLPFYLIILARGLACIKGKFIFYASFSLVTVILFSAFIYYQKDYMQPYHNNREDINYMHHQGTHLKLQTKEAGMFLSKNLRDEDIIIFESTAAKPVIMYLGDFLAHPESENYIQLEHSKEKLSLFFIINKARNGTPNFKKIRIPAIFFLSFAKREPWEKNFIEVFQRNKYKVSVYIDENKLNSLEFKRIWLVSCDWNSGGIDYISRLEELTEIFKKHSLLCKEKIKIGDVSIMLLEKSYDGVIPIKSQ